MTKIVWRQSAINDLDTIFDYIAKEAPDRAVSFTNTLKEKAAFLAENPRIGEAKLPKHPTVRVLPYQNYLLLFRPLEENLGIELLRIIHGARDYMNTYSE